MSVLIFIILAIATWHLFESSQEPRQTRVLSHLTKHLARRKDLGHGSPGGGAAADAAARRSGTRVRSVFLQAACETFDIRGKHRIQLPKLYTASVTWNPLHCRLVQASQPLDLNKGACFPAHPGPVCSSCWGGGLRATSLWSERALGPSEHRQLARGCQASLSCCLPEPAGVPGSRPCFVSDGGHFGRKPWEGGGERREPYQRRASCVPGTVL